MPPVNPLDLVFQSISSLTGGLVTDITTAIIAVLALNFILFGAELLIAIIDKKMTRSINYRSANQAFNDWSEVKSRTVKSRVDLDLAKARYKFAVRRYSKEY